ncbi:hypothetical protein BGW80DRAFT_1314098 [Lactifluus volemus]|nr:hypothetical protein BGW80DRAFT_1314098 [Lactifluus volemus]
MRMRQCFLIRSWVDLPHVYNHSVWMAFHLRPFLNFFYLPTTFPRSHFEIFPISVTLHLRQWSQASPP